VPSDSAAKRLPSDALDAFLDGVLADLRDPSDPDTLNEVRAAFRRRVPLTMRSYAAALLILRAAGLARTGAPRPEGRRGQAKDSKGAGPEKQSRGPEKQSRGPEKQGRAPEKPGRVPSKKADKARAEVPKDADRAAPRPRFSGEATTLFFSMGKRQRLYPRILIDMILEGAKISPEAIGDVRAFDNYSFADIDPDKVQTVVSALDGSDYRGRKLSVGPAKKRDAQDGQG